MSERENENQEIKTALYNNQNGFYNALKFQQESEQNITPSQNLEVTSLQKVTPMGLEPHPAGASQIKNTNSRASISL